MPALIPGVSRRNAEGPVPAHLQVLLVTAIAGAGLMSGLLLAFSLVVMRALRELPPEQGMFAMQRVNVLIVTPLFLLLFLGTAAACLVLLGIAWRGLPAEGGWLLLVGSASYLLGPLGVTVAFNIPLNNALGMAPRGQAATAWPAYVKAWLRWNHLRTALGLGATVLLTLALSVGV